MARTSVYGVVLPSELAKKARVVAAIEGKSRSKLMRELLERYIKNYTGGKSKLESYATVDDGPQD